jgi:hypothetical protein
MDDEKVGGALDYLSQHIFVPSAGAAAAKPEVSFFSSYASSSFTDIYHLPRVSAHHPKSTTFHNPS